jgi:hypothetical protein
MSACLSITGAEGLQGGEVLLSGIAYELTLSAPGLFGGCRPFRQPFGEKANHEKYP